MTAKELGNQKAFPCQGSSCGLTIREHIAIEMMKALVTHGEVPTAKYAVALGAIDYADALIEQLADSEKEKA